MQKMENTILAAQELAEQFKWSVFPVNPKTKTPFFTGWQQLASTDPRRVKEVFNGLPYASIGVRTGIVSNLLVFDLDERAGYSGIASFEKAGFSRPDTVTVRTPSGGLHFYFRADGTIVKNSVSALAKGVDVRGEGGYIICPPSQTVFGSYVWESERETVLAGPRALPQRFVEALGKKPRNTSRFQNKSGVQERLMTTIPEGTRDMEMTRRCGFLLKKYSAADALQMLLIINANCCEPPLEERQILKIFASIRGREGK
jgi:hypothetical protein